MELAPLINFILKILSFFQWMGNHKHHQEYQPRIINGTAAEVGQFPHHAVIISYHELGIALCGGSLISDRWVLTAAHCLINASYVKVHLGGIELANFTEPGKVIMKSRKLLVHENYNDRFAYNDLGLVRLPRKVKFTDQIIPVRLPRRSDVIKENTRALAVGFGQTIQGQPSEFLQFIEVKITSQKTCQMFYGKFHSSYLLCTKGEDLKATCHGDSGGGLITADDDRKLIGIDSVGTIFGCDVGIPDGFTNILKHLDWISNHTGIDIP